MVARPILIAYATRGGTTQRIAEAIAKVMREKGALVEVRPVEQIRDLSVYRAVVLGSGVRDEKWLPEAIHFVTDHRQSLATLPLIYFLVYSQLLQEFPQRIEEVLGHLSEVRRVVEPLEVAIFSRDQQSMPPEMLVNSKVTPQGDWSGWERLSTWAERVYQQFEKQPST
ncbi:MAG: flavodoxin [Meiothermus sp.]|uniref:flavodoxin domain-containing protein n=1 Tax=Meiothermus sp. TaxID=1955249 RepID=UPI0021DB9066|nr:flavodoxin domain-containing protein [Meiothermus sp.]GIW29684.1 MAG: flavodoxin [Meiothermus sp.]